MIRIAITGLAFAACLMIATFSTATLAERAEKTPTAQIAMLYQKLIRKQPDFEAWVRESDEFKKASLPQRASLSERRRAEMEKSYSLIMPTEPIVVHTASQLGAYSALNGGFQARGFHEVTFFDYVYMGQSYALIPNGIAQYQWLRVPPKMTADILRETQGGRNARFTLTLIPRSADPEPAIINNKTYRLIMADVLKIELWSEDEKQVVWTTAGKPPDGPDPRLINLHQ